MIEYAREEELAKAEGRKPEPKIKVQNRVTLERYEAESPEWKRINILDKIEEEHTEAMRKWQADMKVKEEAKVDPRYEGKNL